MHACLCDSATQSCIHLPKCSRTAYVSARRPALMGADDKRTVKLQTILHERVEWTGVFLFHNHFTSLMVGSLYTNTHIIRVHAYTHR